MNTKNRFRLGSSIAAIAVMLVIGLNPAEAKTVSMNVQTGFNTLAPTDTAGVVPAVGWNNIFSNGSAPNETVVNGMLDDAGNVTSIDFRGNGRGANNEEWVVTSGNANATMMTGAGFTSIWPTTTGNYVAQISLTNVLAELGPNYDVYVYYGTGYGSPSNPFMGGSGTMMLSSGEYTHPTNGGDPEQFDVPSATVVTTKPYATMHGTNNGYGNDPTWNDATGFIEATGTSPGQSGNYVHFEDVNIADLVITMHRDMLNGEWNQNSFLGVQLVGEAVVPEPSTFALAGLGLLGLVGYGLRRRRMR